MVDFFTSIYEVIVHILTYIMHFFAGLISAFNFLTSGHVGFAYVIGIVPSFLSSAIICFLGITILKFVVGGFKN